METMFERVEMAEDKHKEVIEQLKKAPAGTYRVARGKFTELAGLYTAVQTAGFDAKRRKAQDKDDVHDLFATVIRGVNGHDGVKV